MKSILASLLIVSSFAFAADKPKEPKPLSAETKLAFRELQLQQRELDVKAMEALLPLQERLAIVGQSLAEHRVKALEECQVDPKEYEFDDVSLSCKVKPPPPPPPPPVLTMEEKRKQEDEKKK